MLGGKGFVDTGLLECQRIGAAIRASAEEYGMLRRRGIKLGT